MGRLILLCVVAAGFFYFTRPQKVRFWDLSTTPAQSNPGGVACFGKEKCLVVYVAPWCSACESIVGCLGELSKSYGASLSVFVGSDEESKLEALAERIGSSAFIDRDRSVGAALKVKSLPTWATLDAKGKVLKKFLGGFQPCNADTVRQYLDFNPT